ncbi:MAG: quinol:cytochrome C oxidoreductase [Deltaproteobacteria bacterium]|nr:quinol:cytochrome C oxidoreductase [Deltaproteobacteria bacterium]
MGTHRTISLKDEKLELGPLGGRLLMIGLVIGVVGLGAAIGLGLAAGDGWKHFFHSYLVAFAFFLTITLGGLFFVTVQHLTRAGWSVVVRRVAEIVAANVGVMAILFLVILVPIFMGNAALFKWTDHALVESDHLLHEKHAYLNVTFFAIRAVIYFVFWGLLSRFFLKRSTEQDQSGDPELSLKMERVSAPAMILFALTITFAGFDLLMSLDPYWFSTIFGVYVFAGSVMGFMATASLCFMFLQRQGLLKNAVTTDHYQDLGKLLFAFVFFWGYIAFSQFMLIWYANIPEETEWYQNRIQGPWLTVSYALLFVHVIIPFGGLLSRYVKRSRVGLAFWAVWLLGAHYLDIYWLVMPSLNNQSVPFGVIDVAALIGVAGFFLAGLALLAKGRPLLAVKDPRLNESLSFENY